MNAIIRNSISVVLPNYNGKSLMEQYIPSIFAALEFSNIDYEFIVIDDCSTDGSVDFIEKLYPNIVLLKNSINSGFSKTCNNGIFQAKNDLIFLVNSDVKLTENYFENQFKYFENDQTFGVMGCIMNFDGKKIEDAARMPRYKGGKFKANKFFYSENANDTIFTIYLSGANALVKSDKLKQIGGFSEIYSPFYFEDFDLGLRAWQMGWTCYYDHQSVCYHRVSASTNNLNKSNFVKITYNRNSFFLQAIHLQGIRRIFWLIQLFSTTLFSHVIKGDFWIFKSLSAFLQSYAAIKESKDDLKRLKSECNSDINLDDIIEIIAISIKHKNIKWL